MYTHRSDTGCRLRGVQETVELHDKSSVSVPATSCVGLSPGDGTGVPSTRLSAEHNIILSTKYLIGISMYCDPV